MLLTIVISEFCWFYSPSSVRRETSQVIGRNGRTLREIENRTHAAAGCFSENVGSDSDF